MSCARFGRGRQERVSGGAHRELVREVRAAGLGPVSKEQLGQKGTKQNARGSVCVGPSSHAKRRRPALVDVWKIVVRDSVWPRKRLESSISHGFCWKPSTLAPILFVGQRLHVRPVHDAFLAVFRAQIKQPERPDVIDHFSLFQLEMSM